MTLSKGMKLPAVIALLLVALVLLAPASSMAAVGTSSSGSAGAAQYPPDNDNGGTIGGGGTGRASTNAPGGLPYTGFAVLAVAALGIAALSGGIALRRTAAS